MSKHEMECKDLDMYIQAKEYMDTVVVPLFRFHLIMQIKQLTSATNLLLCCVWRLKEHERKNAISADIPLCK